MKKYILMAVIGLAVLFAGAAYVATDQRSIPEAEVRACRIENIPITFSCTGTVEASGSRSVAASEIAVITDVFVKKNDHVLKGDLLFKAASLTETEAGKQKELVSGFLRDEELISRVLSGDFSSLYALLPKTTVDPKTLSDESKEYSAPMSGVVSEINVEPGDVILPGVACLTVSDISALKGELSVPESEVYRLSLGQDVSVSIKGANVKLCGKITKLPDKVSTASSLLGQSERYAKAEVEFPNNDAVLPGMSCTAKITTQTLENVCTVPYEALYEDADGSTYVLTPRENMADKLYVRVGEELEDRVVVYTADHKPFYYIRTSDTDLTDGMRIRYKIKEDE